MSVLQRLKHDDYVLADGSAWFTVKWLSVHIRSTDDGVVVDVYRDGQEMEDPLKTITVLDSEACPEEE